MKVLFVCQMNVGRSQMAYAYFNSLSTHEAASAGTEVAQRGGEGQTLLERSQAPGARPVIHYTIEAMKEVGLDISHNVRTQLTPQLLDEADKVVVIAEKRFWPDYLLEYDANKIIHWDLEDPINHDREFMHQTRDEIKRRVEELVREVG